MTHEQAKDRLGKLKKLIDEYRYEYHVNNNSTMSEAAADGLKHELAQIETHLKDVRSEYAILQPYITNTAGPLDVLQTITANTPVNLGINITDIDITGETVKLTASCNSFSTPGQWQALLKKIPDFETVELSDPKRESATKAITFTMDITLQGNDI